jgi:hypothetical protein
MQYGRSGIWDVLSPSKPGCSPLAHRSRTSLRYAMYLHPFGASLPHIPALRDVPASLQAKKSAPCGALPGTATTRLLQTVVHVELDRMGGHAQARDFAHLQLDVTINHVVREHPTGRQELAIGIQRIQGLVK